MKRMLCLLLSLLMLSSFLVGCQENIGTDESGQETDWNDTAEEVGDPYTLEYTSNGDGTCYVSNIVYNVKYEGKFKLEIPSHSPAGDTVTGIDLNSHFSDTDDYSVYCGFPCVMTESTYQRIYAGICQTDISQYHKNWFSAFFNFEDPTKTSMRLAARLSILTAYPLTRDTKIYVFDSSASADEAVRIRSYLEKISYTAEEYYNDMQEIKQCLSQTELYTEAEFQELMNHSESADYNNYLMEAQESLEKLKKDADRYISNAWNISEIVLPDTLKEIGDYAFCGCGNITAVQIPEGVTEIGNYAFCGCGSVTAIQIPEGVTEIGEGCFSDCQSLTEVNIPSGITEIGDYAFRSCYSLTAVQIPEGVTKIGKKCFANCRSLTEVNIPSGVTEIGEDCFEGCSALGEN